MYFADDLTKNRSRALSRSQKALALASLAISALACSEWIPEYTPSAPQATAGVLNSTYEAQATTKGGTATALATVTASPTASDTPTATSTPTSCCGTPIAEVTLPPIVETGYATMPPTGVIVTEAGKYTPYGAQNVRQCASLDCAIVGGLAAEKTYDTAGWVFNEVREIWLCRSVSEDTHGAQYCDGAVIWLGRGQKYGKYEVSN